MLSLVRQPYSLILRSMSTGRFSTGPSRLSLLVRQLLLSSRRCWPSFWRCLRPMRFSIRSVGK
jgi:hypothetical protein